MRFNFSLFTILCLNFLLTCFTLSAKPNTYSDQEFSEQHVQSHQLIFSINAGVGVITNPVRGGDNVPLVVIPQIAFYAEDWFFDNSRGVMEARVIGICPIEEAFDELGEYKGERPLYWIYMPELRLTIATAPVPNPHNDAKRRTYDDLFNKRCFSSYIYQESNVYGRKISNYKQDLTLLLEGKKIEHEIFTFEQDLWEY